MNTQRKDNDSKSAVTTRSVTSWAIPLTLCLLFFALFLIATVIILSLISLYVPTKGSDIIADTASSNGTRTINTVFSTGLTDSSTASITNRDSLAQQINQALDISSSTDTLTVPSASFSGNNNKKKRKRQTRAITCEIQTSLQGNQVNIQTYINKYPRTVCNTKFCHDNFRTTLLSRMRSKFQQTTFTLTIQFANGTITTIPIQFCSFGTDNSNSSSSNNEGIANDIDVLNYFLLLANLQSELYTRYQNQYNAANFITAGYSNQTYNYVDQIKTQEQNRVTFLSNRITQIGGTPVSVCTYNFSTITSVPTYLTVAQEIEQISTNAYVGVISGLTDYDLLKVAGQIGEVEGRHTGYLAHVVTNSSTGTFPSNSTRIVGVSETLTTLNKFIVSCPYTIQRPSETLPGAYIFNGTIPSASSTIVNYSRPMYDNDLRILQLLLNAEQLNVALYNQRNTYLNVTQYDIIRPYLEIINQQTITHVDFLKNTIQNRLATPVLSCNYTFTNNITSATSFLEYARFLMNLQVGLFVYISNAIVDPELLTPVTSVYTITAKHAAYLNEISNTSPFPDSLNSVTTASEAITALSSVQNCNYTLAIPVVPYVLVINATSLPA